MLELPTASIENNLLWILETIERGLKYGEFRYGDLVLHDGLRSQAPFL